MTLLTTLALTHAAFAYDAVEVPDGGTLSGTITYTGTAPAPEKLAITEDVDFCGQTDKHSEALVVGSGGALANVVVFLGNITAGKAVEPGSAHLRNTQCRYEPHVQAFGVGTALSVHNDDPVLHNTHARLPGAEVFNLALPRKDQVITKTITKAGPMKVGCDAGHTWMSAFLFAFDHPYFAVTGKDGAFSIPDVPAGDYELVSWHETLGRQSQAVTVTAGGTTSAPLTYE